MVITLLASHFQCYSTSPGHSIVWASLRVQFPNASLQAYSTHVSPNLNGGVEPPLSVWDPTHPLYFSGTGCQASAVAAPLSGYLAHAQLCIGENGADTVVKEYWDNAQAGKPNPVPTDGSVVTGTNQMTVPLAALFDSTHFMDGAQITIKLKVWDNNNGYYGPKMAGPSYNSALVLGNHTFGPSATQSVQYVTDVTRVAKYNAYPSLQLNVSDILANLPLYTVFYDDSHGFVGQIGDCFATGDEDDAPNIIGVVQINTSIKQKETLWPPYNFVFLDACTTVGDKFDNPGQPNSTDIVTSFNIPLPGNGSDRALLGFNWFTFPSENNAQWTEGVWEIMGLGIPLRDAVMLSSGVESCWGKAHFGFWTSVNPIIQGDEAMTLKGVYGGVRKNYSGIAVQGAPDSIIYTTFIDDWYRPL